MTSNRNRNNRFNKLDPNFLPQLPLDFSLLPGFLQRPAYERKPLLQQNQADELQRPAAISGSNSSKQQVFSLNRAQRPAAKLRNLLKLWQFQILMSQLGSRSLSNTLRQLNTLRANLTASESQAKPTRASWLFSGQPQMNEANESSLNFQSEILKENLNMKDIYGQNRSDTGGETESKGNETIKEELNEPLTDGVAQLLPSMDSKMQNKSSAEQSDNDEEVSDASWLLDLSAYLQQLHQMNNSTIRILTNNSQNFTSELNNNFGLTFPTNSGSDQESEFQPILNMNGSFSSLNKIKGEEGLASTGTSASIAAAATSNASTSASGNRRKNKNRARGQQNKPNKGQKRQNSGGNKSGKNIKAAKVTR